MGLLPEIKMDWIGLDWIVIIIMMMMIIISGDHVSMPRALDYCTKFEITTYTVTHSSKCKWFYLYNYLI